MSILYPRLLPAAAAQRFEGQAGRSIEQLTAEAATSHPSAVFVATGGSRVSEPELSRHRENILAIARQNGFPSPAAREERNRFDVEAAKYLHSQLNMVPAEASSGDVWAFFAVILLPDLTHWRYPSPNADRALKTDLTRHTFGRLWWRAQLVWSNESRDPYEALDKIGGEAFGQIYERRVALGASPALVRAIITVWAEVERGRQNRELLRDFLKRILRLTTFVSFESMETPALRGLLRTALAESESSLRA